MNVAMEAYGEHEEWTVDRVSPTSLAFPLRMDRAFNLIGRLAHSAYALVQVRICLGAF